MNRSCAAQGCPDPVPASRLMMCPRHWFMLPKNHRDAIWRTYQPGQERGRPRPSASYLANVRSAIAYIADKESQAAVARSPSPEPDRVKQMKLLSIALAFLIAAAGLAGGAQAQTDWVPYRWQPGYDWHAEKRAKRLARERWARERAERCRWRGVDCAPRVYSYEERERGGGDRGGCIGRTLTATGGAAITEEGALNQAKRALRSMIRADYGEVYQDLMFAKRVSYRCWRVSTGEGVLGFKVPEKLQKAGFKRCRLWAGDACMPPRVLIKQGVDHEDDDPREEK